MPTAGSGDRRGEKTVSYPATDRAGSDADAPSYLACGDERFVRWHAIEARRANGTVLPADSI
jgi:hypothetical protein